MAHRFLISQDSPALFITIVTHHRLPVFQTNKMREMAYRWSSSRIWQGRSLENEPLLVDRELIHWRQGMRRG
jgi:hypothetical protein